MGIQEQLERNEVHQNIAERIRTATDKLNDLLIEAHRQRLTVDFDLVPTTEHQGLSRTVLVPTITFEVKY